MAKTWAERKRDIIADAISDASMPLIGKHLPKEIWDLIDHQLKTKMEMRVIHTIPTEPQQLRFILDQLINAYTTVNERQSIEIYNLKVENEKLKQETAKTNWRDVIFNKVSEISDKIFDAPTHGIRLLAHGTNRIGVVKLLREMRGPASLGLKEAVDMTNQCPSVALDKVTKSKAQEWAKKLQGIGAVVEVF